MPKKDARTLVARFNEQIKPLYDLLRETEDINLAYEILEPEPTEIPSLRQSKERAASAAAAAAGPHREAWSKGTVYEDLYTQDVVISMEEQENSQKLAAENKPVKERPIWLRESTVQGGTYTETADMKDGMDTDGFHSHEDGRQLTDDNEEVMQALLKHEKKTAAAAIGVTAAPVSNAGMGSDSDSDTSESDQDSPTPRHPAASHHFEDEDDDDEFEEVQTDLRVTVGGRSYLYSEVSQRPELVAQMTPQEKEAYIEMGQKMFEDMYE
ncbi:TPA: hypothetical protein GDO54_018418 [Pyxicephalus adspersus]|uniref:Transcription factor TFIIE alpha subunit C-terminal domain-containing protein n=3 Tax=Pyxicephalus adspersus TaxID=30357 RepID=A0AAV2ZPE3_PYXAD|nr:TPA: hypothetical protein GDO54_018418 [Pyxicephalus adspersus]